MLQRMTAAEMLACNTKAPRLRLALCSFQDVAAFSTICGHCNRVTKKIPKSDISLTQMYWCICSTSSEIFTGMRKIALMLSWMSLFSGVNFGSRPLLWKASCVYSKRLCYGLAFSHPRNVPAFSRCAPNESGETCIFSGPWLSGSSVGTSATI